MSKKMAHHGGHHGGHKGGHSKGKKIMKSVAGPTGMAAGTNQHLNNTCCEGPNACSHGDYFQGSNEEMYSGGGGDDGDE